MNFPVGEVIAKAPLPIDLLTIFSELENISFNGYIIFSVSGSCFEEGVFFFREGFVIAGLVECLSVDKIFKGDQALDYLFNQSIGKGFFQTIQLSRSQVDLITAFDEKLLFLNKINLKDLPKLIPSAFRDYFVIQSQDISVLDKYGLGSLKKN